MKILSVFLFCYFFSGLVELNAQIKLNRISITERSDQEGYVVRFHLSEPVDSSMVIHPEQDLIQLALFENKIDTAGYIPLAENTVIEKSNLFFLENGLGIDFILNRDFSFEVNSYPDVNGRDILLSLERVEQISNKYFVDRNRISWADFGYQSPEAKPESVARATDTSSKNPTENILKVVSRESEPSDYQYNYDSIDRNDPMYTYLRGIYYLENVREGSKSVSAGKVNYSHPWSNHSYFEPQRRNLKEVPLRFFSPEFFVSNNSKIPMGKNDGALWQGRGTNAHVSFGVQYQNEFLKVSLRPEFVYSQNLEFRLNPYPQYDGLSPFAMSLSNIDLPQRFGENSIQSFDWGDSSVEFRYKGGEIGISNKHMWWGPALYNPLLLSNNSPGFKHLFIGTSEPLETSIGTFDSRIFWGGLEESDYFDENSDNNLRYVSGLYLSYTPSYLKNLEVGFARTVYSYYPENGFGLSELGMVFRLSQQPPNSEEEISDGFFMGMSSVFGRMMFPSAGFEIYFEWGRNDYRRRLRDFIAEPELNRGYVFGFLKNYRLASSKQLLFQAELTNLENSSVTSQKRENNIWYTNEIIRHGFTHQGQTLGAGIGPGSSTQLIKISFFDKWGMVGAHIRRIAHHNDRHFEHKEYFRSLERFPEYFFLLDRHEIELRYGIEAVLFLPYNFEVSAQFYRGSIDNRYNQRGIDLSNDHFSIGLKYFFEGTLR